MKNKIIFIFLSFFSLVCFAQNDSSEVKKRKNHFGISFQYGRVTPKLHTNYAYSRTSANVYGLGLTYERDLSKHYSFFSSFQYNIFRETRISILENKELYWKDFGINYYLGPNTDFVLNLGMNYHLIHPKLNKEILSFGGTIGIGAINSIIYEQFNSGDFQYSPFNHGGGNTVYFNVSPRISRRFLLGKTHFIEPYFSYNFMVINTNNYPVKITGTKYYKEQEAKLSFNYGLVGIQFAF